MNERERLIEAAWASVSPYLATDDFDAAHTALSAALSKAVPVVKPLEWREPVVREGRIVLASSDWSYEIRLNPQAKPPTFMVWKYGHPLCGYSTEDKAVAAAQADFERRILSALAHPPAQAGAVTEAIDLLVEGRKYEGERTPDLTIRGEPFYSGAQFRAAFRHGFDFATAALGAQTPPEGAVTEAGERRQCEHYASHTCTCEAGKPVCLPPSVAAIYHGAIDGDEG